MGPWLILIIIVLIILIVWWALLRNVKNYKPDFDVHGDEEHAETAKGETGFGEMDATEQRLAAQATGETAPAAAAPVETRAASGSKDDLTIIEGIGPKINDILNASGIRTFAELAAADVAHLREILESHALHFIDPGTWPEQARLAAEGHMDELQAYMDTLRGGRKVS